MIGANNITLVWVNSISLSIKKSVIYEPESVYFKFVIVENPTWVSNSIQACGLLDLDAATVVVFNLDGKLFLTYGLKTIGLTIGLLPPPWAR